MSDSGAPKHWLFEATEPGDFRLPERQIKYIHAFFIDDETTKQLLVASLNDKHILEGWHGIVFHYVIDKEGNLYTGRPLSDVSPIVDATQIANTITIGYVDSEAAKATLNKLCEYILEVSQLIQKRVAVIYE